MRSLLLFAIALTILVSPQIANAGGVRIDCPSHFTCADSVCFTWVNDETFDICGYSAPPWVIFNSDTMSIAPCSGALVIVRLSVGQSKRYCWNQRDCSGNQVAGGTYEIFLPYGSGESCTYTGTARATFTIDPGPSPSESKTWGRLKSFYR